MKNNQEKNIKLQKIPNYDDIKCEIQCEIIN